MKDIWNSFVCWLVGHDPGWPKSEALPGARTKKYRVCRRCSDEVEVDVVQHDAEDVDLPKPPGYYEGRRKSMW